MNDSPRMSIVAKKARSMRFSGEPMPSTGIAYAYIRVSTVEQYNSRLSIEEQNRQAIAYAELNRLDLGAVKMVELPGQPQMESRERVCEEPMSAYKHRFMRRPVGNAIVAQLRRGDHVIICKVDRGFRDTFDCLWFVDWCQRNQVNLHILDAGGCIHGIMGKMFVTLLALFAEHESNRKSERNFEAHQSAMLRKQNCRSTTPLCFKWDSEDMATRKMVIDWPERDVVKSIYCLWLRGWSAIKIDAEYQRLGIKRRTRGRTHPSQPPIGGMGRWERRDVERAVIQEHYIQLVMKERGLSEVEALMDWLDMWLSYPIDVVFGPHSRTDINQRWRKFSPRMRTV